MTTINKVFAADRGFFVLEDEPDLVAGFGCWRAYEFPSAKAWEEVFVRSNRESAWISTSDDYTEALLKAASQFLASPHRHRRHLGSLLLLKSPKTEMLPALSGVFDNVVGQVQSFKLLPQKELFEVFLGSREEAADLFIGGSVDRASETLTLARGNLEVIVVPLSLFRPSGKTTPNPDVFSIEDYGHTIRLGEYEAAADAILYELDSRFRKRQNATRRQAEKGFGASLRRLRIQRGLERGDFPNLSAKTIARIERGETEKPHGETLDILAETLRVKPNEIETY
jgi:hypothetical protein